MRALPLAWLALWLTVACQAPLGVGTTCSRDSECGAPLVCRLGRCREECAGDRDCPARAHCLFGTAAIGVCTLDDEVGCTGTSCGEGLVCTAEGCRDACIDVCRGGNVCERGVCVPADVDGGVPAPTSCAATRDCPLGLRCVETNFLRVCEATCSTPSDCTGDVDCAPALEANGGAEISVCALACDPITHEGCPRGAFCAFDAFTNGYTSFCRGVAAAAVGEGCACGNGEQSTDCIGGLVCGRDDPSLAGRCVVPCRAGETCADGRDCFLPPRPYTWNGVTYGLCHVGPNAVCP